VLERRRLRGGGEQREPDRPPRRGSSPRLTGRCRGGAGRPERLGAGGAAVSPDGAPPGRRHRARHGGDLYGIDCTSATTGEAVGTAADPIGGVVVGTTDAGATWVGQTLEADPAGGGVGAVMGRGPE